MSRGKRYKRKFYKLKILNFIFVILIIMCVIIHLENMKIKKDEEIVMESEETFIEEYVALEPSEDEQIKELIQELQIEERLDESNFSFFYYNVDSQKHYFYNEDTYFTAASTIKLPIAMLYYDKIRNGEISLEDTIIYTSDCYEEGAGTTASTYSVGSKVPIGFLLEQAIVNSDNTAINILIKNLGYTNCKTQIAQYSELELPENFYTSNITSAKYGYDVVNYLYQNIENYSELIEYLKISSNGEYLKKYITEYDVAHKYGSYNGYVHDYGIVFGEETYLIGIFTKNISNADELIANISLKVLEKQNS